MRNPLPTRLLPYALCTGLLAGSACEDVIDLDPLDETPPVVPRVRARPITGGTLTLMRDDTTAVVADADRDLVHVVDLEAEQVVHTLELEPGDEPWRVVEGSEGLAHVVLRGAGGVLTLDREAGKVIARHRVCAEPRGLAFHPGHASLYLACAEGVVVQLEEASGRELGRTVLEPDLRDVVIARDVVHVSTFRSASLLTLDGQRRAPERDDRGVPRVAWRTFADPEGDIVMLHQNAAEDLVPIEADADESPGGEHPYGGGGSCTPGISNTVVTIFDANGGQRSQLLPGDPLSVDIATADDRIAIAMPGVPPRRSPESSAPHLGEHVDVDSGVALGVLDQAFCGLPNVPARHPPMQTVSVAFRANGDLVAQSREPARLAIFPADDSFIPKLIDLPGESRFDTGHELFHRATDSGLSCASCHPEGTDDGHVWNFEELGARRTQPLDVGLADTAPFHWDGDMEDLDTIMGEVLAHRMGGHRQSPARRQAFSTWMFAMQRPAMGTGHEDPAVVEQGRALFAAHACTRCHNGAALGGTTTEAIQGRMLQVPTLRRVALHPPYMHDGRSATLEDAVEDMVRATSPVAASPREVSAMAAYLRTL